MYSIEASSVNQAFSDGLVWLCKSGVRENSRNGPVIVSPVPVCTTYLRPERRVLFSPTRDANPFFHVMEALWMLAGQRDLKWPVYFNSKFAEYSDDGRTVHGAYGYRWREWFGFDQLEAIAEELRKNPSSRRCVLSMWDGQAGYMEDRDVNLESDLHVAMRGGKDVPCNTHAYFDRRGGVLNLTVLCRSNDVVWGAYGANAVHFSMLLEYMAAWIGVPIGVYRQVSVNFHLYTQLFEEKLQDLIDEGYATDFYDCNPTHATYDPLAPNRLVHLVCNIERFDAELEQFLQDPFMSSQFEEPFLRDVAGPMYKSWWTRKEKRGTGLEDCSAIAAWDWRNACSQWIMRRENKKREVRSA